MTTTLTNDGATSSIWPTNSGFGGSANTCQRCKNAQSGLGSNVISTKATWFIWSTRLLPEACDWSAAFYKHFPMRRAACVPPRSAPRTVSSNDRLQSCASWPQLRTIDASGTFDARLGCKMDSSFLQRQPLLLHLWTVFSAEATARRLLPRTMDWHSLQVARGLSPNKRQANQLGSCLSGERLVENISNCSMLYVHIAACFTGKNWTPASCNCGGV